ncbi:MAG: T9SS type A sorting domain-containing protein [Bacteroidales bacterium]|nr:T9SS type A sorting domain-containing protein [Bacteroidales bacterium]
MKKKILPLLLTLLFLSSVSFAQIGGYALQFDGTKYVDCGNGASVNITGKAITLEAWIFPTAFSTNFWDNVIVNKLSSSVTHGYNLRCGGNGQVEFYVSNTYVNTAAVLSDEGSIQLNTWSHLAGTYDGKDVKLYINGKLVKTTPFTLDIAATDYPLYIGNHGNVEYPDRPFIGRIDEVRVWNIARSEAQIKANMYKELAGDETNLVAYYKMSNGSGTTLTDNQTSGTNTGTLTYGPTWKASGAFAGSRQALDFDGSNDHIRFNPSPAYNNAAVTVEAWINSTSPSPEEVIVCWGSDAGLNDNVQFRMYEGKLQLGIDVGGWQSVMGNASINTGSWIHVAVVKNNSSVSLYVNGILDATGDIDSNPNVPNFLIGAALKQGSLISGHYFPGKIDEVRIWNTARTEAEIRENMMRNLAGNENGLVAYYRFDHLDGTTLYDQTSNANNGTLTNMEPADWVASSAYTTWIGSESDEWDTGTNWSNGTPSFTSNIGVYDWSSTVPNVTVYFPERSSIGAGNLWLPAETNAEIGINVSGSAFIGGTFDFDDFSENLAANLIIQNGSTITLPEEGKLTVSNYLENKGTLTLNNLASLKTEGSISNTGTINMHKSLSGSNAWQMISGPAVADISDNEWNPADNDDFYAWLEASPGTWVNYKNTTTSPTFAEVNVSDNFVAGKGYLVSYQTATVEKTITGTPNTGDHSFRLENDDGAKAWDYTAGWNLIGNPYPSFIDWYLVDHTATSKFQDVYAYWYNPNKVGGANYEYIDGSSADAYIAPFQGFFVLVKMEADDLNFTFTNDMRTHFESGIGKAKETQGLRLRLGNETFYDETSITQQNESQHTRDRLDALKMYSFDSQVPQLYSFSADGAQLAINSIPTANAGSPVALAALFPAEGTYTISLQQNDESLAASGLFLEDRLLGVFHKIVDAPYVFLGDAGESADRFYLHFGMVDLPENSIASNILIWQQGDILMLTGMDDFTQLQLFDINGRLILNTTLNPAAQQQIAAPKTAGVYMVRLIGANQMITEKVVVYQAAI